MTPIGATMLASVAGMGAWGTVAWCLEARGVSGWSSWLLPGLGTLLPIATLCGLIYGTSTLAVGCAILSVSAIVDIATGLIYAPLARLALGAIFLAAVADGTLSASALGACAGMLSLAVPYLATSGRGLGLGDVRLGGAFGATVGADHLLCALGWACGLGAAFGVVTLIARSRRPVALPFAPFLALGAFLSLLQAGSQR